MGRGADCELWVCHLGRLENGQALEIQARIRAARQEDELPDVLLMLEHEPVYTRGRRSGPGELPFGEDWYRERGISIYDTRRGGKVTYHGPGQLVGYPIVRVGEDVLAYVRLLEDAIVGALGEEGVSARGRTPEGHEYTGVWVGARKIASIGVHVSRGVTMHGFAVNVENDLEPFSWIVPCGLGDVQMTSLARETAGHGSGLRCFRKRAAFQVAQALGRRQRLVSLERVMARTGELALQ
jgi:lipoyl(octanoyl) transferase